MQRKANTPYSPAGRAFVRDFEQALRLLDFHLGRWSRFFHVLRGSAEQALRHAVMTRVKHNIRLSPAQDRTLIRLAEQRGLTCYGMLGRVVDHGLAVVENGMSAPNAMGDLTDEIAAMSVRLVELERVLDRALFTACASYSYARQAALGGRRSDEAITAEAHAAYDRQRSLASTVTL